MLFDKLMTLVPCRYYTGGVEVSANDPSSPSGFLTCLNGPPLEGVTCEKGTNKGIDLSNRLPMEIDSNKITDDAGKSAMAAMGRMQDGAVTNT
jgi:hypothetical protein